MTDRIATRHQDNTVITCDRSDHWHDSLEEARACAKTERIATLTPADMVRAYSGRRGCGCGCRGSYHDGGTAVATRILNTLKAHADEAIAFPNGYAYETPTHNYWVYTA